MTEAVRHKNPQGTIKGARIHIGDMSQTDPRFDDDLASCDDIAAGVGCHRSMASIIAREAVMRLQLRLVSECVGKALPKWTIDAAVSVVVFVVENRLSEKLIYGDITIDDVLDAMDDEGEAA